MGWVGLRKPQEELEGERDGNDANTVYEILELKKSSILKGTVFTHFLLI